MADHRLLGDFSGQISGSVASIGDRFHGAASRLQLHGAHYRRLQGSMYGRI